MNWSGQSWGPQQPRVVSDLTGDGRADIAGFGLDGVWVALNNGNGAFQAPNMVLAGFNFHTGWVVEKHPRLLAVEKNGRAAQPLLANVFVGVNCGAALPGALRPAINVDEVGLGIVPDPAEPALLG